MSEPLPLPMRDILKRRQDILDEASAAHATKLKARDALLISILSDATKASPAERADYLVHMLAASDRLADAEALAKAALLNAMEGMILYQPLQFKELHTSLIAEIWRLRDQLLIDLALSIRTIALEEIRIALEEAVVPAIVTQLVPEIRRLTIGEP